MPYPPGGGAAQRLEKRWAHHHLRIPARRAGDRGSLRRPRQPADGATILYATSTTMAINASAHKNLAQPIRSSTLCRRVFAVTPFVLVVNASLPINSVADLAAQAKAQPRRAELRLELGRAAHRICSPS